jgi:Leucine-rich repeat (LRR) protein
MLPEAHSLPRCFVRRRRVFRINNNLISGTIPTEINSIGSHVPADELALAFEDLPASAQAQPTKYTYTPPASETSTMGLQQFDVSHNNLNGTIPTTIGDLINLQAVDVSDNPYLGRDGCCEGADAQYTSFYGYNTTIPTEIGMLKKLQVLKMDHSGFMRQIPTEVGSLRSLRYWRLKGSATTNQVSGTIPSQFGKLTQLSEFMMESNVLSGTLPSQIGDMVSLERFQVQDNQLNGTIPDMFHGLERLNEWDTFNNQLDGTLPSSIQLLGNLEYLYIQNDHTEVLRNHYCKQRIESSALGRKHNYQVISKEYINYKELSACANPHDVAGAFDALSGDV